MPDARPWLVLEGDCLHSLPTLEANSVDAVVCDPPYGLSFMGKEWDHGVPGVAFWREALRVARPGAHLVAFGGTRTYHRLACAIEDAGWEIRDCLSWLYGSGFPKSLDVSKAMDKMDATEEQMQRRLRFTAWVRSTGVTSRQIDEATGTNMGGHYTSAASQPAIMTREHLEACRHLLGGADIPEWVERECDIRSVESRNFAEREVVGRGKSGIGTAFGEGEWARGSAQDFDITAPATDLARQWQGWGTALKPAWEPIILARKPLIGTVASNVAAHGTGAINVDGCRIEFASDSDEAESKGKNQHSGYANPGSNRDSYSGRMPPRTDYDASGRWPANVVLDEAAAAMLDEQTASLKGAVSRTPSTAKGVTSFARAGNDPNIYGDTGGASRFFYTAKASRREREAGLEGMPTKSAGTFAQDEWNRQHMGNTPDAERNPVANVHPTVKPIALMRWLCRLVTPKGGLILDPFTGSGTTGCAAVLEGFRFVGIEREAEYVAIAEKRIAHWAAVAEPAQPSLFDTPAL